MERNAFLKLELDVGGGTKVGLTYPMPLQTADLGAETERIQATYAVMRSVLQTAGNVPGPAVPIAPAAPAPAPAPAAPKKTAGRGRGRPKKVIPGGTPTVTAVEVDEVTAVEVDKVTPDEVEAFLLEWSDIILAGVDAKGKTETESDALVIERMEKFIDGKLHEIFEAPRGEFDALKAQVLGGQK